jgi:hypothetical protein
MLKYFVRWKASGNWSKTHILNRDPTHKLSDLELDVGFTFICGKTFPGRYQTRTPVEFNKGQTTINLCPKCAITVVRWEHRRRERGRGPC